MSRAPLLKKGAPADVDEEEARPPNPVVSWSRAAFASASILVVLLYVVLAVLRTMLTKALFNINFNPVAFSAATAFCTCVALVPVFVFDRRQWAVPKREYLPQFLVVCALCAVNLAGTNTAVAHLSLTLQQCLVATIPAFTVVVESGYKRTLAHPAIYATILALCAGPIVMATGYSGVISPLGVVAQMLAVASSACKSVILHALLDKARRLHRRAARARATLHPTGTPTSRQGAAASRALPSALTAVP